MARRDATRSNRTSVPNASSVVATTVRVLFPQMRLHLSVPSAGHATATLLGAAVKSIGCTEADDEVDGVVISCALPPPASITDLELSGWIEAVEDPLAVALENLLDARRRLRPSGGSILFVLPN